mmetsp:Transcript_72957/g.194706  ORF Transcript_72957/g.194706 Transcript_72957/m.194706 type:complete len:201 (+) Transcript_72957:465-1067(+)
MATAVPTTRTGMLSELVHLPCRPSITGSSMLLLNPAPISSHSSSSNAPTSAPVDAYADAFGAMRSALGVATPTTSPASSFSAAASSSSSLVHTTVSLSRCQTRMRALQWSLWRSHIEKWATNSGALGSSSECRLGLPLYCTAVPVTTTLTPLLATQTPCSIANSSIPTGSGFLTTSRPPIKLLTSGMLATNSTTLERNAG